MKTPPVTPQPLALATRVAGTATMVTEEELGIASRSKEASKKIGEAT